MSASFSPTYTDLASLRGKLNSGKITERRAASKQLLEKLQNSSVRWNLELEAQRGFDASVRKSGGRGGGGYGNGDNVMLPRERVATIYRSLIDAALLSSEKAIHGTGGSTIGRQKRTANQTGYIKKSCKFNADDILFPYKVFLRCDGPGLEYADGGYSTPPSWDVDWKSKPRYGFHFDPSFSPIHSSSSSGKKRSKSQSRRSPHGNQQQQAHHGSFSAAYYTPHTYTDDDRGTILSTREIIACVNYCITCLGDADCCNFAETELLQWLGHICSRPDYVACLPVNCEVSYILDSVSLRLNRAFEYPSSSSSSSSSNRGILSPRPDANRERNKFVKQECLLASAKCLCALVYQCTTRLGIGMHLYIRPVVELVATWAENVWRFQSGGGQTMKSENAASTAGVSASSARPLRTEADILALVPYLFSSVTHLIAAHPEQAVPILSDHGYALIRMARKFYGSKVTISMQVRDALSEYFSAHLLVAETSGKLSGLVEGDLGPLVPNNVDGDGEGQKNSNGKGRKRKGEATLSRKWIMSLLDMLRSEKVWDELFPPGVGSVGAGSGSRKNKRISGGKLTSLSTRLGEGGLTWVPLNRRQRRHLELVARLVRVAQRLHLAEAESVCDSLDPLGSLVDDAEETMRRSGLDERGEIEIDSDGSLSTLHSLSVGSSGSQRKVQTCSLVGSPWIRMISQHLYKLNPKLGLLNQTRDTFLSQNARASTLENSTMASTQKKPQCLNASSRGNNEGEESFERILLRSCPMLQALVSEEETRSDKTINFSILTPLHEDPKNVCDDMDSVQPSVAATLQLICACAEIFPRGESWSSSAHTYWSVILDERAYRGVAGCLLERHGSSPADAASVVYLLGTTLEYSGGSGGDNIVQLWTLMALLKMTQSSAIICSREGVVDASSFGSKMELESLRVAWQYVWKTLFRHDLRYSSYTSGAFASNAGELVIQLLTQIVRYQCTDRNSTLAGSPPIGIEDSERNASTLSKGGSPFIFSEQDLMWKLPVFENSSNIFSPAPFELLTSVATLVGLSDSAGNSTSLSPSNALNFSRTNPGTNRQFISFCLQFIELAFVENSESSIRRALLPFASISLAALIDDGNLSLIPSTYELEDLFRFGISEDIDPIRFIHYLDAAQANIEIHDLHFTIWMHSVFPGSFLDGLEQGPKERMMRGQGPRLNKYSDASYEREQLEKSIKIKKPPRVYSANTQKHLNGDHSFHTIKSCLEEVLLQFQFHGDDTQDEDDTSVNESNKLMALPQLTVCLCLLLNVVLARNSTSVEIATDVLDIFKDTFEPVFNILLDHLKPSSLSPSDLLATFGHLEGLFQVLTCVSASVDSAAIPRLFADHSNSLFILCQKMLKNFRQNAYTNTFTANGANGATVLNQGRSDFDSDNDDFNNVNIVPSQPPSRMNSKEDDSDSLMDDEEKDNSDGRHSQAQPFKRRRVVNVTKLSRSRAKTTKKLDRCEVVDSICAWACSSLMIVLSPSIKSLEIISSHIVWPEDYNEESGHASKTPDPFGALVCASIFCKKKVILRKDCISKFSSSSRARDECDDQSALILCIEIIREARKNSSPASKTFMCGFGLIANLIEIGECGQNPLSEDECKLVLDALYPEGVDQNQEDYRQIRQLKKTLKFRTLYRDDQLCSSTEAFLFAKDNLHRAMDNDFANYFVKSSIRHIDEIVRESANDALAAALTAFDDQQLIVSELMDVLLPLHDEEKLKDWLRDQYDPKLPDDLTRLEEVCLNDALSSFEFHAVECIGLIAGTTSDPIIQREMIWKLVDLSSNQPSLSLLCRRACERAAYLLGFRSVGDFFDDIMPHLLTRWIESQSDLRDIPLLLSSPFTLLEIRRNFPNEMAQMLTERGGWDDSFWIIEEAEGESKTLRERLVSSFLNSVASYLVPIILLSASDKSAVRSSIQEDADLASKYLTECTISLAGADIDENVAKILRFHIKDIFAYIFVLRSDTENTAIQDQCQSAVNLLQRCVSEAHIEREGAKQSFLVLRRLLRLHGKGVSVVGHNVELPPAFFIEAMKSVSNQLKKSDRGKEGFLHNAGSSLIECFVLVKYWLSTSQNNRQREDSWKTFSLMCDILKATIRDGTIVSAELCFSLHCFISTILDSKNVNICPLVLKSLKSILCELYSRSTSKDLIQDMSSTIHKMCLALLHLHDTTYLNFRKHCELDLSEIEFTRKCSKGLFAGFDDLNSTWGKLDDLFWEAPSNKNDVFKGIIISKALNESVTSDILISAYDCLEIIAENGELSLRDILGAEDIVDRFESECTEIVFQEANEKYSIKTLFDRVQQSPMKIDTRNLESEFQHCLQIMREYPISIHQIENNPPSSGSNVTKSIGTRARLLALRRLEKSINEELLSGEDGSVPALPHELFSCLINVCHSSDPEESRLICGKCLGETRAAGPIETATEQDPTLDEEVNKSLDDPLKAIKHKALAMLCQFLLSDCAETSFVAMKTAKALLATPDGKDCWRSLDASSKAMLKPFVVPDDVSLRKEAVRISMERLKNSIGAISESWCWSEKLWAGGNYDSWIKKVVCAIIGCELSTKGGDFFWVAALGLCAKEAAFAHCIFPGIIFYLLESDEKYQYEAKSESARDKVLSKTALGSPNSRTNEQITDCFSRILLAQPDSSHDLVMDQKVVVTILNTLEMLRAITEYRFLSYPDHKANISTVPSKKSSAKNRRSRDSIESSDGGNLVCGSQTSNWRGFPYGVVLKLDGISVALACFHAKRFYSAIYYAEMGMQNLLGCGNFFEVLAGDTRLQRVVGVRDISGFGMLSPLPEQNSGRSILESALLAQDIIGRCLSELQEHDDLQGVLSQASALNLKQNITSLNTLEGSYHDQTFPKLLDLDTGLEGSDGGSLSRSFAKISNCLDELGLNHTKRHYLVGVESTMGRKDPLLREQMFEDSLNKTCQWDDLLLPRVDDSPSSQTTHEISKNSLEAPHYHRPLLGCQIMAGFNESVYEAVQCFIREDIVGGSSHILQARKSVLNEMAALSGSESSLKSNYFLSRLKILSDLDSASMVTKGIMSYQNILRRWSLWSDKENEVQKLSSLLLSNDDSSFTMNGQRSGQGEELLCRTELNIQETCLKLFMRKFSNYRMEISHALSSHIFKSCRVYRELGRPDAAKVSLMRLRSLMQRLELESANVSSVMLRLEDAKILKCQDDLDAAIMHCKLIVSHLNSSHAGRDDIDCFQLLAESQLLGSSWMAHQNVESATTILSSFKKAAASALEMHKKRVSESSTSQASKACFKLGEFASNMYDSVNTRVASEAWRRTKMVAAQRKEELAVAEKEVVKLQKRRKSNDQNFTEMYIHQETLRKEVQMDESEIKSVEGSVRSYLHMAMNSYLNGMKLSTTSIDASKHVFQLVGLWFKNCQRKETQDIVNGLIKSNESHIPSYRWVPLIYQLFSRIDEVDDGENSFQITLRDIVFRICSDHPYHGIVQLIALSNGKRVGSGVSGRHASAYLDNVGDSKVEAAKNIIQDLQKRAPRYVASLVESYGRLMDSYIELAMLSTAKIQEKQTKRITFSQCKLKLDTCLSGGRRGQQTTNVENAPVIITKPPTIRPDGDYGNGTSDPIGSERVVAFESTFDLTPSGIHRPKIVICIGSKGGRFKQLVKGEDDLRQDAIMQQVFVVVNNLLKYDSSRLRLVTYGITPLSPASGVLEWVDNTMSFSDFLTDGTDKKDIGAHSKYNPGEWGNRACRKYFESAKSEDRRKVYDEICRNFSPAFRFFFLEYFSSSMESWHCARSSYTRSCAVSSIVGHILGIGDRHTQNILIHTKTGEVVHIDFGIVFEQGKTLTTPETVPFRLTRDVVDGMGPCGTDGSFSKCAEATMGVLRENADTLLTILSAVVSDPLYKWNLSPLKARQKQNHGSGAMPSPNVGDVHGMSTSDENRNDSADRAIRKIHEKLQGYEDGTSGEHKTVAGQVKLLINEARDPNNLCALYHGWGPWI